MSRRADEIRKRIAKRKNLRNVNGTSSNNFYIPTDEERYGGEKFSSFESGPSDQHHPLWSKEVFFFKILFSAVMVLGIAIIYKNSSPIFDDTKGFVQKTMKTEFQFAAISNWYEEQFGKPLALFPQPADENVKKASSNKTQYAIPAGKVVEGFTSNGKGIMLETEKGAAVQAMSKGVVIFAGKKDDLGNTVIIQHPDKKTESWYGHLENITVTQYENVTEGMKVGTAADRSEGDSGEFYLAIKQGDQFVDPNQVISFE
ncbi:M23 family metallopeptidase [Falsibacillus albus]|uniref:M23 family metallopeptidase n=1 Tax=Falsibacillus albus TaxID=2478915 RepID=A0A3L7K736_9BACI|nr:M23 family metallopeptidase [Falsibacillus albus]RLQ98064.1 M23 family metallopeptidase [Falsibacillus albus]